MAYPQFKCAYEKDNNPPLTKEADQYFQIARQMEKSAGIRNWPLIESNYQKAIDLNHWKAMNNLAILYRKGAYNVNDKLDHPTGIVPNKERMLALYARMVQLKVPMGYYNWAVAIQRGQVKNAQKGDSASYMHRAAELGYPPAQVAIGNHFAFGLPQGQQRKDLAEAYFRCAGAQDNTEALIEVADFFYVSKENMPLAAFYYQRAASLGSTKGFMFIMNMFREEPKAYNFGYLPNPELSNIYKGFYAQLRKNPNLTFPNLMKEHPLPRHPTQGYDADHPDTRPQ